MDASDESQILSFSKIVINTQMLLLTGIKQKKKERKLQENGTLGTRLLHSPLLLKWGSQMTLIGSVKDRTRSGVGVGDSCLFARRSV